MGTIPPDFETMLVHLLRDVDKIKRRPSPMSAADLLGPGMASLAIQIDDWDSFTVNGNVYSEPGARHTPDPALRWTGTVLAKNNGSGMQQVWNTDDLDNVLYRMRTYVDAGPSGYTFSPWKAFATPTGYVEFEHLDPEWSGPLVETLDEIANQLEFILPELHVYRQNTAPTNPDDDDRALQVGDIWIETDSGDHVWMWDGDEWIDYAGHVLDLLNAQNPVTGGVLQTSALPNVGIKITSGGMVAYDDLAVATFILDADDGTLVMRGSLVAGSDINGATVTGGTVQTEATALRGIKMNSAGMAAYDGSGNTTFVIEAATGALSLLGNFTTTDGAIYIGAAGTYPHIKQSVVANAFESDQDWALLQFFVASGWNPGQVWGSTVTDGEGDWATLRLNAPYTGSDYLVPAYLDMRTRSDGLSRTIMRADEMQFSADTFTLTSTAGAVDFNLVGTSTWSFRDGGQRLNIVHGSGLSTIESRAHSGGGINRLALRGTEIDLDMSGVTGLLQAMACDGRPGLGSISGDVFIRWGGGSPGELQVKNPDGSAWRDARANLFTSVSDMRFKKNVQPVGPTLDVVMALEVIDYQMAGRKLRQRGVSAQQLQTLVPHLVRGEEDDDGLGVDTYGLTATLIKAVQELVVRVAALEKPPKK